MAEKKELLETRFSVRREAEKQKRALLDKVERMKKVGDFSKDKLAELGLTDLDDLEVSQERQTLRSIEHDTSQISTFEKPQISVQGTGREMFIA
jgi:hypothetical protein